MRFSTVAILSFSLGVAATLVVLKPWHEPSGNVVEPRVSERPDMQSSEAQPAPVDPGHFAPESVPVAVNSFGISASPQSNESRQPIALPDGFPILERLAALHDQLEVEDTDHVWASYLKPQLAAYFADERLSEQQFGAPMVECRRTLCEVQLVGYGPRAFTVWANVTEDYASQPWMADLLDPIVQVDRTATGAAAFVIILQRRPGTF